MRQKIKLTESQLRNMIQESVRRLLNEESEAIGFDSQVVDDWYEIREALGDEKICDAFAGYVGQYELQKFIEFVKKMYMDNYYENEEEEL